MRGRTHECDTSRLSMVHVKSGSSKGGTGVGRGAGRLQRYKSGKEKFNHRPNPEQKSDVRRHAKQMLAGLTGCGA
jgi:hypothetical protein